MSGYLQEILEKAIQVVEQAGAFQMKHFRSLPSSMHDNKALRELVSFVDVESEKILQEGLSQIVPEAGFYGEETGKSGSMDFCWIVDPLDGTTNYLSGVEHFVISAALFKDGETILGIVYKPATKELFSAIKGHGLFHNKKKLLPVSNKITSKEALFVTGFPYRSPDVAAPFFACAAEVLVEGRGIRRFGAAAMDLGMVAAGWLQGFWETDLQPYDVASALLFLQENGCVITNGAGEKYNLFKDRMLVVALPGVHSRLLEIVQKHYGKIA